MPVSGESTAPARETSSQSPRSEVFPVRSRGFSSFEAMIPAASFVRVSLPPVMAQRKPRLPAYAAHSASLSAGQSFSALLVTGFIRRSGAVTPLRSSFTSAAAFSSGGSVRLPPVVISVPAKSLMKARKPSRTWGEAGDFTLRFVKRNWRSFARTESKPYFAPAFIPSVRSPARMALCMLRTASKRSPLRSRQIFRMPAKPVFLS